MKFDRLIILRLKILFYYILFPSRKKILKRNIDKKIENKFKIIILIIFEFETHIGEQNIEKYLN